MEYHDRTAEHVGQQFALSLIKKLEGHSTSLSNEYYKKQDLEGVGFLATPTLERFFEKADVATMDYVGSDVVYHYTEERVYDTLNSPFFWFCCYQDRHQLLGFFKAETLKVLFDTPDLDLNNFQKLVDCMKNNKNYSKDTKEQFLKANRWQKDILLSQAKSPQKWMYDWDMPQRLKRFVLQRAISKPKGWGQAHLLGYGGVGVFKEIVDKNTHLERALIEHHGFKQCRDKHLFYMIAQSGVLPIRRMDKKEVFKQTLFYFKQYSDLRKAVSVLGHIQHDLPDVFRLACLQHVKGLGRMFERGEKIEEACGRFQALSHALAYMEEDDVSFVCSCILDKPFMGTLLENANLHPVWHNTLEKKLLKQHVAQNNSKQLTRKM